MQVVYFTGSTDSELMTADANAALANATLVIQSNFALTSNRVLTAPAVRFEGGQCDFGIYTLTFPNGFSAEHYHCFLCSGSGDPASGTFNIDGHPVFSNRGAVIDPRWFGAKAGDSSFDNAEAFNLGLRVACEYGLAFHIPTGAFYIATTIQACVYVSNARSLGPSQITGDGYASGIFAADGMRGEMIFARNMSGVRFAQFLVDGGGNPALKWLNTTWYETGPHQLNIYEDIIFQNLALGTQYNDGNVGVGHCAKNNNQSIFRNLTYRGSVGDDKTGVALDLQGSGGSYYAYDLTVDAGVVRLTCQNAVFVGGSFHGFEFSVDETGNNLVGFKGIQVYSNARLKACFSSANKHEPGYYITSLTFSDCQHPVLQADHAVFDLILTGEIRSTNTFIAPPPGASDPYDINLFGPGMAGRDSSDIWNAKVLLEGGGAEHPLRLVTNAASGNLAVGKCDFRNYGMFENIQAPDITRVIHGPFDSGIGKNIFEPGELPDGTYLATIRYDHGGDGDPYLVQGTIIFPITLMNYSGSAQICGGNFVSHTNSGKKFDVGITPATSQEAGLQLIPNFSNAGTAQTAVVHIMRLH